ncbi:MAG: hypothetical protein C4289_08160 [Chloroflexota bacterium]
MFARVSIMQASPKHLEEGIRYVQSMPSPGDQRMAGFRGAFLLVDRTSAKVMTITLWETEQDVQESAEGAGRLRAAISQAFGFTGTPVVEVYEVAAVDEAPGGGR